MLQRNAPDRVAQFPMGVTGGRLTVHELGDVRARPDLGNERTGSALFGGVKHNRPARVVDRPGYGHPLGFAPEPAGDDQGSTNKQVGQAAWVGVGYGHAAPVNLDIGERCAARPFKERTHDIFRRVVQAQVGDCTAPHPGHAFQQVAVGGFADPETEYTGAAEARVHLGQNVCLVTDITVRQKRDKTEPGRAVGKSEGCPDPLDHPGTALAIQVRKISTRSRQVLLRRRDGLPAELGGIVREADNLERIVRVEQSQRRGDGFLGLRQGTTPH